MQRKRVCKSGVSWGARIHESALFISKTQYMSNHMTYMNGESHSVSRGLWICDYKSPQHWMLLTSRSDTAQRNTIYPNVPAPMPVQSLWKSFSINPIPLLFLHNPGTSTTSGIYHSGKLLLNLLHHYFRLCLPDHSNSLHENKMAPPPVLCQFPQNFDLMLPHLLLATIVPYLLHQSPSCIWTLLTFQ